MLSFTETDGHNFYLMRVIVFYYACLDNLERGVISVGKFFGGLYNTTHTHITAVFLIFGSDPVDTSGHTSNLPLIWV